MAADDLVHELVARARVRLDAQVAVAELAGAARLLLVAALGGGDAADGLAVRDAQAHGVRGDAGAVLEAVEQDGDLRLADRGDDRLAGLLVAVDLEGRVGLGGLLEEGVHLALAAALVGLDRDAVEGVGEAELGGLDLAGRGEGVAGERVELGHDADVAGGAGLHVARLAAHHAVQVREALALAGARAGELGAGRDGAGEHLEEGEAAVLRVGEGLEDEGDRTVVVGRDVELLAVDERHAAEVGHRGEPLREGVEVGDDALLAHARAGEDGHEHALDHGLAEQPLDLLLGDLLALEVLHHQLVVGLDHELDELGARRLGGLGVLGGDLLLDGLAVLEVAGRHVDDVDDALEVLARAPRQRHGAEVVAEVVLELLERRVEVRFRAVEAVDEEGAREGEVLGGVPQAGGDGAGARLRVDDEGRRLGGAHRGVGVAHEVGVAGGVEDVDADALPLDGRDRGGDGEAAGGLLAVVVEGGLGAGVAAEPGGPARQVQHRLGQHGLPDAALAYKDDVLDLRCACHVLLLITGAVGPERIRVPGGPRGAAARPATTPTIHARLIESPHSSTNAGDPSATMGTSHDTPTLTCTESEVSA